MSASSKLLAALLALSMTALLALPLAIFADDPISEEDLSAGYEQPASEEGAAEAPTVEDNSPAPTEESASEPAESDPSSVPSETSAEPDEASKEPATTGVVVGGFQTFGLIPLAADAEVKTWAELRTAIADSSVSRIILLNDIQRTGGAGESNDLPAVNRSLEIDGNNHSLDLSNDGVPTAVNRAAFKLARASAAQSFSIHNIRVARGNATSYPLISADGNHASTYQNSATANWTINISNLVGTGTPTSGLVVASDSSVVFSGNVTWDMAQESSYNNVNAKTVTFAEYSQVSLKSGTSVIVAYPATQNLDTIASVEARTGAQVSLHSYGNLNSNDTISGGSAIRINEGINGPALNESSNRARSLIKVANGAQLSASSNGSGYGRWGGVIVLGGGGGGDASYSSGRVAVEVTNGGRLIVDSFGAMPAMVQQIPRATFKVAGSGSQLSLHSTAATGSFSQLRAALRFRYVGNQTFDVSEGARVDITLDAHTDGNPAAIRFGVGPSNDFRVSNGGQVYISNGGNGVLSDDTNADGDNVGIEYDANSFGFYLQGEDSVVKIAADAGPAIDANGKTGGEISVGEGSIFIAQGNTASNTGAIFRSGNNFSFSADHPKYYDFSNIRAGGGRIFNIQGNDNTFSSTYSDVAVWGNGTNGRSYNAVDGNPYRSWTLITYTLSGENFGGNLSSDDPDFNETATSFGPNGLLPYTRISGNNGTPTVYDLEPLTNADKYVRSHVTIPEGPNTSNRGVWDDEVWVDLEVQPADGSPNYTITATSLEGEDIYEEEQVGHIDGVVRYSNGGFLKVGDRYRVVRAWRGNSDPNASRLHLSRPADLPQSWFTVTDVTPPVPVTITSHTELWPEVRTLSGTYSNQAVVGAPYNTDPLTAIYAAIDDTIITDASGNTVYATLDTTARTWSYTLPSTITSLPLGSALSFIAVDASNNSNPIGNTQPRHDTVLPSATSLNIQEFPAELFAKNKLIGFVEAQAAQSATIGLPAALKNSIEASAANRPGKQNPYGTAVSVIPNAPAVLSFAAETFAYDAWIAKYGAEPPIHLESYEIPFQLDGHPAYTSSGTLTVFPRNVVADGIAANDFDITALDAAALVARPTTERDAELINRARALAWDDDPLAASSNRVRVFSHTLPASPAPGTTYTVTFVKDNNSSKLITVDVRVGTVNPPVITFLQEPLVITRTVASHILSADELKAQMTVIDAEDADLKTKTEVFLPGSAAHPSIDSHNTGVYVIEYRVVDSEGASTSAKRVVVVNDGRYVIVDENGDGQNELILGAQDFVLKQSEVTGNVDQVRSASYAEAYSASGPNVGANLSTSLQLRGIPTGYGAGAQPGTYPFVWEVTGYNASTSIVGTIVDADVLYPGTKFDPYALVANNFQKRLSEAAFIVSDADFIAAADAQAYRLVGNLANPTVRVIDRGSFAAATGSYPISFGLTVSGSPLTTAPPTQVIVTGSVGEGTPPKLELLSPIEVAQFTPFSPLTGVIATDADEGSLLSRVGYNARTTSGYTTENPVDSSVVGLYPLRYWVFDTDGNKDDANRLVVVNDGSYKLGAGRVLYGKSFVARLSDVGADAAQINSEIISRSLARTYGNPDGNNEGPNGISIPSSNGTGGYGKAVGEYDIILQATDVPTGFIQKNIKAKVIGAEVLEPSTPSPTGTTAYVYGNNSTVTISEAQAIAAGGDSALLSALGVGVTYAYADGSLNSGTPVVSSVSGPQGATAFSAAIGQYTITVSDATHATFIDLTMGVGPGRFPTLAVVPQSLELPVSGTPGTLTEGQLRSGVTAKDFEDGDLTSKVTYEIFDVSVLPSVPVSSVPANAAGIYRVIYSIEDSDGNRVSDSRALILNDGRYTMDSEYILAARSFVIGLSSVVPNNASGQILEYSQAGAWRVDGSPAQAEVQQTGGYTDQVRDYSPIIGVAGHPALTRTITAKVFNDSSGPGGGNGANGDHYAITANNFRINYTEANVLITKVGTADYGAEFVRLTSALSYDRTDQALAPQGTPELQSDDGFAVQGPFDPTQPNPSFKVRLQVAEEPTTWVEAEVLVSNATAPVLSVPATKTAALGSRFTEDEYLEGVSAQDTEDGVIPVSAITHDYPVNTAVPGTYPVTYRVTDSDYNSVTAVTVVTVLSGNVPTLSYVTPISIPTAPANTPNIERNQIIAAGSIRAFDAEDGDITDSVQLTDLATGETPSVSASTSASYNLLVRVTDSHNNTVEAQILLVVSSTPAPIIINNILPAPEPEEEPEEEPEKPATKIEEPETPTTPDEKGWSLLNLIAVLLSLLMLSVFGGKYLLDRTRAKAERNPLAGTQAWADMTRNQRAGYLLRHNAERQATQVANAGGLFRVNQPVLAINIFALFDAALVLFTTQNFGSGMAVADNYTIVFVLILLVQFLTPIVATLIHNYLSDNQNPQGPTPPSNLAPGGLDITL
jgi:hypothetical protein